MLPRSLLGRSLLIILVPLIVVQAVALLIFYGSHLDLISRRLSGAVAGEIAQTIRLLDRAEPPRTAPGCCTTRMNDFDLHMQIEAGAPGSPRARASTSSARWTTTWPSPCASASSGRSRWTGPAIRNPC